MVGETDNRTGSNICANVKHSWAAKAVKLYSVSQPVAHGAVVEWATKLAQNYVTLTEYSYLDV